MSDTETKDLTVRETQVSISTNDLSGVPVMQAGLADWCREKIVVMEVEAKELGDAYQEAVAQKWKSSTLKRHAQLALRRVQFYRKVLAALEAGYCLFPTVDCMLFAVRTDQESPTYRSAWMQWGTPDFRELAALLPAGEGEYVNPEIPSIAKRTREVVENGRTINQTEYTAAQSFDHIDFPLVMAKPHIMDAAGRAMALKVFDQLGIVNDTQRSTASRSTGDPVIVGRILDPRVNYGSHKVLTFLISWHVDTRTL